MSNVQDIEKRLADAEHEQELYNDNRALTNQRLTALRNDKMKLAQEQTTELERANRPIDDARRKTEEAEKELLREREKYEAAGRAFKAAEEKFNNIRQHSEEDIARTNRAVDSTKKKFEQALNRIDVEITRRENEERTYTMKAENARRDTELLRRRLDDARRQEMEELRRNSANTNSAPTGRRYGTY